MKKIFNIALLLFCSFGIFTACEDDNDSNPTLLQPTELVLNTPTFAGNEIDLSHSEGVNLSWSQPVYTTDNAPVVATYEVQVSTTGAFAHTVTEANADATGATVADYYTLASTYTVCSATVPSDEIALALSKIGAWEPETVPDTQVAYVRLRAYVKSADGVEHNEVFSNVVSFTTVPYYMDDKVEIWYLVGAGIGDGSWSNKGNSDIGVSLIPMYQLTENVGKPIITYTGYFSSSAGFKLIKVPGESSWAEQWGTSDGKVSPVKNDGGSSNFFVQDGDGYYTITLDTRNDNLTIKKADVDPAVYAQMLISGDFNTWGTETLMNAINTTDPIAAHNHDWAYTLDASAGATTAKFLTDSSWGTNWGETAFPIGIGKQGGANIPVKQGKWVVTFNDIDGAYVFTSLDE